MDATTQVGNISDSVGIAIGSNNTVNVYYYPIKLHALLREVFDPLIEDRTSLLWWTARNLSAGRTFH